MNKKIFLLTTIFLSIGGLLSFKIHAGIISPDKYYLDVNNSEQISQTLLIYSAPTQKTAINYKIKPIGVKKIGENNERYFYESDINNKQDAANWIKILNPDVTVNPGEYVEVKWVLNIPTEYTCETKLTGIAVIEVNEDGSTKGTEVELRNEVISQVHLNTTLPNNDNCKYYEDLILQDFYATHPIPIYNYDNITFKTVLENRSEYLSKNLKGFIEIIGFGEKETLVFNENNLDIYPKSIREFTNTWIDPDYPRGNLLEELFYELTHFKFGLYTVRLGITKNIETPIVATINIVILPIRLILLVLIILVVVMILFKHRYKNKKFTLFPSKKN